MLKHAHNARMFIGAALLAGMLGAIVLSIFGMSGTPVALGATCPWVDNDGGDADASTGTYQFSASQNVASASTFYDCTSGATSITTFVVPTGVTLTFLGTTTTGDIAEVHFTNLQVNSGGTISADTRGCLGTNADGAAPNTGTNICGANTGRGIGNSVSNGGGGGGGYGGAGGAGTGGFAGGSTYGSATATDLFGASGGGGNNAATGGNGGGVIRLDVAGTFTHNGTLTADGGNGIAGGGGQAGGGGSGGSIYITTPTFDGSTGVFTATGGNGADNGAVNPDATGEGGGGGGGRIIVEYNMGTYSFDSGDFNVSGGTAADGGTAGTKGTVYVVDTAGTGPTTDDDVSIFHGFTYTDTDYSTNNWTTDATATNQYCNTSGSATPSITAAATLSFSGTLNCSTSTTSFTLSSPSLTLGNSLSFTSSAAITMTGSSSFSMGTGVTITDNTVNTDINLNFPAGPTGDQAWSNVTVNIPREGELVIDDAMTLVLSGTTSINGNVLWTNLTGVTIDSTVSIIADFKGCTGGSGVSVNGTSPNSSNVCGANTGHGTGTSTGSSGGGGAGHGGTGGNANTTGLGGAIYGSATVPDRFGSGGGGSNNNSLGGHGGGKIRIQTTGTFTHNGTLTADGQNGTTNGAGGQAGGGGSGGTIYLTASVFNGTTGTFTATGGNGADSTGDGGGGGGGRVVVEYNTGTYGFDSGDFSVAGGTVTGSAVAGAKGTVYVVDTAGTGPATDDDVNIFHGFTYTDTDYSTNSWTIDAAATNQYCVTSAGNTPSITTVSSLTFNGTLNCSTAVTSFTLTSSAGNLTMGLNSSFTVNGAIVLSPAPTLTLSDGADIISSGAITMTATTDFSMGAGVIITDNTVNTDVTINIPASDTQSWASTTVNVAREGDFIMDDAFGLSLSGTTDINANILWTNLTSVTIASGIIIDADQKGCGGGTAVSVNGTSPNSSNVCGANTGHGTGTSTGNSGGGGAGHGGAGGNANTTGVGGATYGSSTVPDRFGSGGGASNNGSLGGHGGGKIRIQTTGTFTHNGTLTADAGNGTTNGASGQAGGGGSGGTIYLTASVFDGTTGVFTATGGNGADSTGDGGGGGGGRIAIEYGSGAFSFDSTDFTVTGGTVTGSAVAGGKGTVYLKDTTNTDVRVFHGFTFTNVVHSVRDWIIDASATNQYCDPSIISTATPQISATRRIYLRGRFLCGKTISSITYNATETVDLDDDAEINVDGNASISAGSSFNWNATNLNFTVKTGGTLTITIPTGTLITINNGVVNAPGQAQVILSGAATFNFTGTTQLNGNFYFNGSTAVTVGVNASINANVKGCVDTASDAHGYGPNGSNVCTYQGSGYGTGFLGTDGGMGGGAYGGRGGNGSSGISYPGGSVFGNSLTPTFYGATGGSVSSAAGGTGGGALRFDVGTLTLNGSLSANGGNGAVSSPRAAGGGSGGSVYIVATTMDGTGTITANGGNGGNSTDDGGGGGGGRVAVYYGGGNYVHSSASILVNGGSATGTAVAGTKGTGYVKNTGTNDVAIYHGFQFTDVDHSVRDWILTASATNVTCDSAIATSATPSITATRDIQWNGSFICGKTLTSFGLHASGSLSMSSGTLDLCSWDSESSRVCTVTSNLDMTLPVGQTSTWTDSQIRLASAATSTAGYSFTINDAASIDVAGTTKVYANVLWTNLVNVTVGASAAISADHRGCIDTIGDDRGYGPNTSTNVCTYDTSGAGRGFTGTGTSSGGGGYGGAGGSTTDINYGVGGSVYGSATAPTLFGSSAGTGSGAKGGTGGGYVRISMTGILTNNGSISANGRDGFVNGAYGSGGGSGGTVAVTTTGAMNGTGSFSANGGAGADGSTYDGGGGGGGRIAVLYGGGTFTLSSTSVSATGGVGPGTSTDGAKGTGYVKDTVNNNISIYHGFTFTDVDYAVNDWTADASATNQYCDAAIAGIATPSVSATGTLTFGGTLSCTKAVTSFNWSAGSLVVTPGASMGITGTGTAVDINLPASSSNTWSNFTFTGAPAALFTINDAVAITLTGNSHINANAQWTALTSLTIDSGSDINATGKGCVAPSASSTNGSGPNGSNVCTVTTTGYGTGAGFSTVGAGHGGRGGRSSVTATGSATYGSSTAPVFFGSSAGTTGRSPGPVPGNGGGYVRINATGTLTLNGSIIADGGAGEGNFTADQNYAAGGGSGGSVYVTVGTIAGTTGTFSSKGGNGGVSTTSNGKAGGGGGGRVAVTYATATLSISSSTFSVSGGTATSAGVAGTGGTVYVQDTTNNDVYLYHGFTWTDTDYSVRHWIADPTTTNQACGDLTSGNGFVGSLSSGSTPSVTASGNITLGGTMSCQPSITSMIFNATGTLSVSASANYTANTALTFTGGSSFGIGSGATIAGTKTNADMNLNIPAGIDQTWSGVTISNGPEGDLLIDDAIAITLTGNSHVTANVQWTALTNLTIDNGSDINASSKGCVAPSVVSTNGSGPNGSNVCTITTAGYGKSASNSTQGAGHGGAGGRSASDATASPTYGSPTAPVLYGSSAGTTGRNPGPFPGPGGGLVRIVVSGTLTLDGSILANGGAGQGNFTADQNYAGGGGSGGSIYVTTGVLAGSTGLVNSKGGDGGVSTNASGKGGGGGGGRISISYTTHSTSGAFLVNATADTIGGSDFATHAMGGTATSAGVAGSSGTLSLTETGNPVPTTISISPDTKTVGDVGFTMTVNGTNFVASSVVRFAGSDRATTFVSSVQVTASILTADMSASGTFSITVFNPTPGGGTSNAQTFTVNNPVPTTTSINPAVKDRNSEAFSLTVNGTNFTTTSIVRFAGSNRTTAFVSSVQITASIPASDLTATGTFAITVFNPAPAGGTSNAQTFTIVTSSATSANKITMSRLKAGAVTTIDIAFTLQNTLSTPLTVTFPAGFTVLSAATGGSACLSSFGFTASTLTASKTNCTGAIIMSGATVQNPSTPGTYFISWVNDDPGGGTVIITDNDQSTVTASINPSITFNVGAQAAATACDGTFSGNGGSIGLSVLSLSSVATSDASGVPHICSRIASDASSGAAVAVRSLNAGLRSTAVPADIISSATATLAGGTAGYGLCVGSAGADSGKTDPAGGPASAAPARSSPFNGASCASSGHDIGGLTVNFQNLWTVSGPSFNAFARIYVKASISPTTAAHNDYSDTLTFVVTGTY